MKIYTYSNHKPIPEKEQLQQIFNSFERNVYGEVWAVTFVNFFEDSHYEEDQEEEMSAQTLPFG